MTKLTFRFDDVCVNSDIELHNQMTDYLFDKFPGCQVIWAISPLVHSFEKERQRVFPKEWNALSDPFIHCNLDTMGVPPIHPKVIRATHGLIHVDHRLLSRQAQKLSILLSASLVKAEVFVPPFNKWNEQTEEVCGRFIPIIKYEDGWRSMEYNSYTINEWYCSYFRVSFNGQQWYLHARQWTMESFKKWFEG